MIQLANRLYNNPLIRNINQEAKGVFVTLPRKVTWVIGSIYRSMIKPRPGTRKGDTIFGDTRRSGPSYIPAETFATTLLETLEIPTLVQKLTELRLEKFKQDRIKEIEEILDSLKNQPTNEEEEHTPEFLNLVTNEFEELKKDFNKIIFYFHQRKASLTTTINRMAESLDRYIDIFQTEFPKNPLYGKALRRLKFLKEDIFDEPEGAILLGGLRPNITEIMQSINKKTAVYKEIEAAIKDKDSATYQKIEEALNSLPESVIESLSVLAKRAQAKVKSTEEGLNQLRQEIEIGFDRTMDRASGVYKRNAKGVGILIGFCLAVAANADTFHMVSRLSKDSALRDTITENAGQILTQNPNSLVTDLQGLRNQANQALADISLPIGWTAANLEQQMGWVPNQQQPFPVLKLFSTLPGWILSGLAIAMGAPFWFDLLSKVVNVRNAGKAPASTTNYPATPEDETPATRS